LLKAPWAIIFNSLTRRVMAVKFRRKR